MISGVVITYNVEDHISACLASLKEVCSEIIVIDAHSTDETPSIARRHGAILHTLDWNGYGKSKNYGAGLASNDWILSMDSDEYLSSDLIQSIQALSLNRDKIYQFQRINLFRGKAIKHGFYKPEWKSRLFYKNSSSWSDCEVHESLILPGSITMQKCRGSLNHKPFESVEELRSKLELYAEFSAKKWKRTQKNPSFLKRKLGPTFHFIKSYLLQLGFLEGKLGWVLAREAAHYSRAKLKAFGKL